MTSLKDEHSDFDDESVPKCDTKLGLVIKKEKFMKKLFSVLVLLIAFFAVGIVDVSTGNTANRAEAATVKQVRAMHILVSTEQEAADIRKEIMTSTDKMEIFNKFRAAAKKYSKCPSGAAGGDLGWFGKGDMVPEFEKAAFELPSGEVSEPVKTAYGWHLIYVVSKK